MEKYPIGFVKIHKEDLLISIEKTVTWFTEYYALKEQEAWENYRKETRWSWRHFKRVPLTDDEILALSGISWDSHYFYPADRLQTQMEWIKPLKRAAMDSADGFVFVSIETLDRLCE